MTICIGALYDDGKGCILASDAMVTAHFPIGYEFESGEVDKIVAMSSASPIHALVSGDVLVADAILSVARKSAEDQGITTTSGIAELVRAAYQSVRVTNIVRAELEPRGLDLGGYYNNQQRLQPALVQFIDRAFAETDVGVELIVAGLSEAQCSIYTVTNPGQLTPHDAIWYAAIGTGAPHALYSLIDGKYKKSLDRATVESMVKEAKRRSEVAPGVGGETKIVVIPAEEG
jgi:hypothetical protein